MTVVRRKPTKRTSEPVEQPWPSSTITPRCTRTGKVSGHPGGPVSAIWEEALGASIEAERMEESRDYGAVGGLMVALSVLTCRSLEELYDELEVRLQVADTGKSARRGG